MKITKLSSKAYMIIMISLLSLSLIVAGLTLVVHMTNKNTQPEDTDRLSSLSPTSDLSSSDINPEDLSGDSQGAASIGSSSNNLSGNSTANSSQKQSGAVSGGELNSLSRNEVSTSSSSSASSSPSSSSGGTVSSGSTGTGENSIPVYGTPLVADPFFERGFSVNGPQHGDTRNGRFDYGGKTEGAPLWGMAPWFSRFPIGIEHEFTEFGPGHYEYKDVSKRVEIDTNEAMIALRLDASEEFTAPRKDGEDWPHILIGQSGRNFTSSTNKYFADRKITNMEELRVTLDTRLTYFHDAMGDAADPSKHACGFYIYLYMQNFNRESKSYGQIIWFGFPIFDNRQAWNGEYGAADGGKEDASGMFIYQIPQNKFMSESFWKGGAPSASPDNPWIRIDYNCIPSVHRALQLAQQRGFMTDVTIDDFYYNGFNIGWEMYGTYDGEIQVKNFQVYGVMR